MQANCRSAIQTNVRAGIYVRTSIRDKLTVLRLIRSSRWGMFIFLLKFALTGNPAAAHLLCWKAFAVCPYSCTHPACLPCPAQVGREAALPLNFHGFRLWYGFSSTNLNPLSLTYF